MEGTLNNSGDQDAGNEDLYAEDIVSGFSRSSKKKKKVKKVKKYRVEPIMEDERQSDGNHDIDGPEKGVDSERSPFRDEAY